MAGNLECGGLPPPSIRPEAARREMAIRSSVPRRLATDFDPNESCGKPQHSKCPKVGTERIPQRG